MPSQCIACLNIKLVGVVVVVLWLLETCFFKSFVQDTCLYGTDTGSTVDPSYLTVECIAAGAAIQQTCSCSCTVTDSKILHSRFVGHSSQQQVQ